MNLEQTYYLPYRQNRLSLSGSLLGFLNASQGAFANNVPPAWRANSSAAPTGASALDSIETCYWSYASENGLCLTDSPSITGNLMWTLHLVEQYLAHSVSSTWEAVARSLYWPLLRRAVNYYVNLSREPMWVSDGSVHLPVTFSPEYATGNDTSYDLMLMGWGLDQAIRLAARLNISDPNLPLWQSTLSRLTPPHVDPATGWMIAWNVTLSSSHRHYSHLMAFWPLQSAPIASDASIAALATQSLDHWISMPSEMTGFARPAASEMSVLIGRGAAALSNITELLTTLVYPNTMYAEAGGTGPCTETPYSAAYALADHLLHAFNGSVLVFRGVDGSNATLLSPSFVRLRVPSPNGPLLVSSTYADFATQWILVEVLDDQSGWFTIEANMSAPWAFASTNPYVHTGGGGGRRAG
jgi:alpha-L-fucosidase 2